jgi:glycosyltransferase involved in cell wall biosynthesis
MATVSVVISTYNRAGFLAEAIDGALAQTLPPHEIIVVDDGSTDETPGLLAAYGSRIRAVRQTNRGTARARNAGAGIASSEWLAFLDSDDAWLPRKLERQIARATAEPGLGLIHCGVEEIDAAGTVLARRLDGREGRVAERMILFEGPTILGGGSAAVVPRAVFETIGGFDEAMTMSVDWDLFYRVASRWPVGFVAEVLARYRFHDGNLHKNVVAMEHDMLLAYAKAFTNADAALRAIERRCYGNLHTVLAGSFFSIGGYRKFAEHALRAVRLTPSSFGQFAGYPLRWLRREAQPS